MKNFEDKLQEACVTWFKYQYPNEVIFAIPNGGSRNPIEAAKLKRTGTLAGVADLFIASGHEGDYLKEQSYGLFIELKIGKNKQTKSQVDFMLDIIAKGYRYSICRSVAEFMKVVNEYLN